MMMRIRVDSCFLAHSVFIPDFSDAQLEKYTAK